MNTVPAGAVEVTVTADSQTEVSTDGTNFSSTATLTFTTTSRQTVTTRAIDDADREGLHTGTLTHAITTTADPTDYPTSLAVNDLTVSILDNELTEFERLDPLGGLIFRSDSNNGSLVDNSDQADFEFFAEAGQTISVVAEPTSSVSLTVELVGVSGAVTATAAGNAVVMPPQMIASDGTYTIRVTSDAGTDFTLEAFRNAPLERQIGNTADGTELNIGTSFIQIGSGRYGVVGTSEPIVGATLQFTQSNSPGLFVDISGTGTALNLLDEGEANITTTVGNSIFPSGDVRVGNNGVIFAGTSGDVNFQNDPLPTTEFGNALIPYWEDLDDNVGNVYWEERQVDGINTLIVQWEDRSRFDNLGDSTFQVQLFESGPVLARYAYQDVIFGNPSVDGGAGATIGYQENTTTAIEFSRDSATISNGDVLDLGFPITPDIDEYEVDLTGKIGSRIDILLAGVEGTDFSGQTVELRGPDGTTVLATAVSDPVSGGTDATNYDLGILGFTVPADGVYTLHVDSSVAGDYSIVITDSLTFDSEPNTATDPLRSITDTGAALGHLNAVGSSDRDDFYTVDLTAGDIRTLSTTLLFDDASTTPLNSLDPELRVIHPDGSTVIATDFNSGIGNNAELTFTAPQTGTYRIRVRATSGAGEYLLKMQRAINPFDLATLNGTNGFRLDGSEVFEQTGTNVSSAGDINGDGFDDLIVAADLADAGGKDTAGNTSVVFGRSGGFASAIDLTSLDGTTGFRIGGIDANDRSGYSVNAAGDVNGDGFDDILIGAPAATVGSNANAGEAYLIFGKAGGFTATFDLTTLDGSNGIRFDGIDAADQAGDAISSAGDINGDGFNDIIIAGSNGNSGTGEIFVVLGQASGFSGSLDLATLNGTNGFRLDGVDAGDRAGVRVSSAGDSNGDGLGDLIIGSPFADPGGDADAGESYVVFGTDGVFASAIDLASLNGTNGFRLDGIDAGDQASGLGTAGDVNGDGFDDLVIGAIYGEPGGNSKAGETYIVFGKGSGFTAAFDLATLDGTNGFRVDGLGVDDYSGRSVSAGGDINGDGFDDVIIGALGVDSSTGATYVVFGKSDSFSASLSLASLDGDNGFRLTGIDTDDRAGRAIDSAGDVNGDGFDDIIIGAVSGDPGGFGVPDSGETYVVFGDNFTGGNETQVGTSADNVLTAIQGSAAIDVLIGHQGDDTLISDGGSDVLTGGEGDDTLAIVATNFQRISGGNGTDQLRVDGTGVTLDLTTIADNRVVDIEEIDITGSGNNTLTLDFLEVVNISTHSNTLTVRRDSGDVVNIGSGWTQLASETIGGTNFEIFTQGAARLQIEDPTANPGFTITETGGTSVSEAGTTDTFTVVLELQPSSNVVLTVVSADTGEATVDTGTLTFTPANWDTPQAVTVTGIDDDVVDGNQTTIITMSIDDANSDNAFDPLSDKTVSVTTIDNDVAGFTIAESGGGTTVSETGTIDTFTVVLDAEPLTDVVLSVVSADTDEATVSTSTLTFTPANWDTTQTVTVTGVDDAVADANTTTSVTVAVVDASSDNAFDPLSDQIVTVTTTDNDVAALTLTIDQSEIPEIGGSATGTVTRNTATTAALTVNLTTDDGSEVSIPATVEIPIGQSSATFTINAFDDLIADGLQNVSIFVASPGFIGDSELLAVNERQTFSLIASVDARVIDDDGNGTFDQSC